MATTAKPTRRGGRPSRAAAEGLAGQIVAVARAEFFAHGYGPTSIEAIAKAAGISKRTFYARFENKAALFKAVVGDLIGGITPVDIEGLFAGAGLEEILQKLAQAMLHASLNPQTLALQRLMIAEAVRFPELALVLNQQGARHQAIARIAEILARETTTGGLAVPEPLLAAELFLQMVVGLPQRRALGLGQPLTPQELSEWGRNAVRVFLHGYGGTAASNT
jgi:TetR/AcrR family transcriptional repressor of mexJK operon